MVALVHPNISIIKGRNKDGTVGSQKAHTSLAAILFRMMDILPVRTQTVKKEWVTLTMGV